MLLSLLLSLLQNFCNKSLFVKCARERRIYDRLVDDFKTNIEFTLFQTSQDAMKFTGEIYW